MSCPIHPEWPHDRIMLYRLETGCDLIHGRLGDTRWTSDAEAREVAWSMFRSLLELPDEQRDEALCEPSSLDRRGHLEVVLGVRSHDRDVSMDEHLGRTKGWPGHEVVLSVRAYQREKATKAGLYVVLVRPAAVELKEDRDGTPVLWATWEAMVLKLFKKTEQVTDEGGFVADERIRRSLQTVSDWSVMQRQLIASRGLRAVVTSQGVSVREQTIRLGRPTNPLLRLPEGTTPTS